MNRMNRKNLAKCARYFEHPPLRAKFSMHRFSCDDIRDATTCGSVGCVVGQSPYAGIKKRKQENWILYAERVFGIESDTPLWGFLFSGVWARYEKSNTPAQAAARIRFVLRNGRAPKKWDYKCVYPDR